MDFYRSGQRAAAQSFFKEADYADALAGLWGKISPAKIPLAARIGGGVLGGGLGALGAKKPFEAGFHAGFPIPYKAALGGLPKGAAGLITKLLMAPVLLPAALGTGAIGGGLAAAPVVGGGAAAGALAAGPLFRALVKNRRAAAIRNIAPKAGLALGATATAAALAHHFLKKKRDE